MRLLNLGCGATRPGEPWINLDSLHGQLAVGTPERMNLDAEPNYIDWRIGTKPLPFDPDSFDGVLASHIIEHMDAQEAVRACADALRVLKPGGVLMVSVPDASYFRRVHADDTRENAVRLFGEPIHEPDKRSFFDYGLMFRQHVQLLTDDSLWAILRAAGFADSSISRFVETSVTVRLASILNRVPFSLVMVGVK